MKAHRFEVLVVDHDNIGADEAERYLEDTKYPNNCMSPTVLSSQTAEIGEWEDDNPLNFTDKQQAEVERLFSPWQSIETAPKDGSFVMVWNGTSIEKARYDEEWGHWIVFDCEDTYYVVLMNGDDGDEYCLDYPTHWCPMLTPPKAR